MTKVIQDKAETFTGDPGQTTLDTRDADGSGSIPAAPSNFTAAFLSSTSLRYGWKDNSYNEDDFEIWTSDTENGTYAQVGEVGTDEVTFDDIDLSTIELRWAKVRASNSTGKSAFSNKDSATTDTTQAPVAPTEFNAIDNEDGTIDTSWLLSDDTNTTSAVQIWKNDTTEWVTLEDLDSTPAVESANNIAVPAATGATVNASDEYGTRLRVSNSGGFDVSNENWQPLGDSGNTVTAGTIAVSVNSATELNIQWSIDPTNYTTVQLQRIASSEEGVENAWVGSDVAGADTFAELEPPGWDDSGLTSDVQQSYRVELSDGGDIVYTPIVRNTPTSDTGGGNLIFEDDFSDGTLNAWSSHRSGVSVVQNDQGKAWSARATYVGGQAGYATQELVKNINSELLSEVYIEYEAKFTAYVNCKWCKVHGFDSGSNRANTTFTDQSTGTVKIMFGPGTGTQNDTQVTVETNGAWKPYPGNVPAGATEIENTAGSVIPYNNTWVTCRARVKFSDSGAGEIEFWVDGDRKYKCIGLTNKHPTNNPIDRITFFDYSNGAGSGGIVSYANVKILKNGWSS